MLNENMESQNTNTIQKLPAYKLAGCLEEYRQQNHLTQAFLAEKIGWKKQFYSYIIRKADFVNAETILAVVQHTDIPLSKILNYAGKPFADYPPELVKWLQSPEGKKVLLTAYSKHLEDEANRKLVEASEVIL